MEGTQIDDPNCEQDNEMGETAKSMQRVLQAWPLSSTIVSLRYVARLALALGKTLDKDEGWKKMAMLAAIAAIRQAHPRLRLVSAASRLRVHHRGPLSRNARPPRRRRRLRELVNPRRRPRTVRPPAATRKREACAAATSTATARRSQRPFTEGHTVTPLRCPRRCRLCPRLRRLVACEPRSLVEQRGDSGALSRGSRKSYDSSVRKSFPNVCRRSRFRACAKSCGSSWCS